MKNFVIFGASGDLAKNYLFPALENIIAKGHHFNLFGFGRSPAQIPSSFTYVVGQYNTLGLSELAQKISSDSIFYFALPTRFELIKDVIDGLNYHHLINKDTRLVIEKPFGTDHQSAKQLMSYLQANVGEDKIFLVDHYLTKHLVKNIVHLRFSNPIFAHLWNSQFITEINITATETRGIDDRGEYYDKTGAIRDMFQNHLLQLLALVTMNQPNSYTHAEYVRQKTSILSSVVIDPKKVEIGQYQSYQQEVGVDPKSTTETFAKIRLKLNSPNWRDVPINIVTAKKLDQKITEINIIFRQPDKSMAPNQLTITLHPQNDIILTLNNPKPISLNLGPLDSSIGSTSAYENMLHDLIDDVKINTPSFEEILLQWEITDKILSIPDLRSRIFTY